MHAAEENVCARVTVDMSCRAVINMVVLREKVRLYRRITCSHLSAFTLSSIRRSGPRTPERLTFLSFAGLTLKKDEGNYGGKCPATD